MLLDSETVVFGDMNGDDGSPTLLVSVLYDLVLGLYIIRRFYDCTQSMGSIPVNYSINWPYDSTV